MTKKDQETSKQLQRQLWTDILVYVKTDEKTKKAMLRSCLRGSADMKLGVLAVAKRNGCPFI